MDKITFSIAIIAFLSFIGVVGDFFIKLSGAGPETIKGKWFIIGFMIYGLTAFGWFYVMKNIKLATLGVFYAIFSALFLVGVGVFYKKSAQNYPPLEDR